MKLFLFANTSKSQSKKLAIGIREYLTSHGAEVFAEDEEAEELGATPLAYTDPTSIHYMISMGGDGTILRLAHKHEAIDAPILGINLGHLGFLADVPISEIYPSLTDLLEGRCTIDERLMIEGTSSQGATYTAANDIVIHRASNSSLVEIGIHVDGLYLNNFVSDGLIVSTPSGSTAYSLAAGGPILTPNLDALAITPISPHTISNRPIVISASSEITIQHLSDSEPLEVRTDGMNPVALGSGETYKIKSSQRLFKLVSFPHRDYYTTVRTKLGWTGKLR